MTTKADRDELTFDAMIKKFEGRFKLNSNATLSNYKFRNLIQGAQETFDQFVIRVKQDSKSCDFSCESENCGVAKVMCRDQIIFGTSNDQIRKEALRNEWNLDSITTNGRALEAAVKGAEQIKKEEPVDISRTKPGKYSKKYKPRKESPTTPNRNKCKNCSSTRCQGDAKCFAKNAKCYECNQKGHYKGAATCRKSNKQKKARKVDHWDDEETETEDTASKEEQEESRQNNYARRLQINIPTIHRVGGCENLDRLEKHQVNMQSR